MKANPNLLRNLIMMFVLFSLLPNASVLGDFDGDGRSDVFCSAQTGELYWYENISGAYRYLAMISGLAENVRGVKSGSLDGDEYGDLVIAYNDTSVTLAWMEAVGNNTTASRVNLPFSNVSYIELGDFDGDDKGDLIFNQAGRVYWFENTANNDSNLVARGPYSGTVFYNACSAIAIGDLDHVGGRDILVSRTPQGLEWVEANGNDSFYYANWWYYGGDMVGIKKVIMGDINADGITDVFYISDAPVPEVGTFPDTITWREYDAASGNLSWVSRFTEGAKDIALADFDYDGRQELVVIGTDGSVKWLVANERKQFVELSGSAFNTLGNNNITVNSGLQGFDVELPCGGNVPIVGDLDGDCDVDINDLEILVSAWLQ